MFEKQQVAGPGQNESFGLEEEYHHGMKGRR